MLKSQRLNNTFTFCFLVFCLLSTSLVFAQNTSDENTPKDNSPYSRIGLGDFVNSNFAASTGMGGLGATFNDAYHANTINPASLSFLRSTAFEVGLFSQYSSMKDNPSNQTFDIWSGNINYLSLSFPMRNPINEVLDQRNPKTHWGMNISLLPFTTVGYNVTANTAVEEDGDVPVVTNFSGRGGTYKIQWGNAVKHNNLSVGVNIGHAFGKLINERDVLFADTLAGFDTEFLDEISIGGFYWNAGVMYKHKFKSPNDKGEIVPNGKSITVGVYGNSNNTINSNTSQLYRRISRTTGGVDTLSNIVDLEGEVVLPSTFGIGIMYENFNKMRIGFDYSTSQWSNYRNDTKPDVLNDAFRIAVGGEYIPDINSYNNYAKKMRYRLGAFYETDPRNINEQLTNYGITLGLGFPVILPRQQVSFFNFALEVGQFGTDTAFQETYVKGTFAFTLNDNSWFFKRKFQ